MSGRLALVVCLLAAGCKDYEVQDLNSAPNPLDNAPDACVVVSPGDVEFGAVEVGGSETEVVTILNSCDGELEIYDLQLQDPGMPFVLGTIGTVLVPGQSSTDFTLTFEPGLVRAYATRVLVDTNDPETPTSVVMVSGEGGAAAEDEEVLADAGVLRGPARTEHHVLTLSPDRGTLTLVDGETLEVTTLPLGVSPDLVLATGATAVVLDTGLDAVHLVDTDTLEAHTVEVWEDMDRMRLSPDGRWAVLWRDSMDMDVDGGMDSFNVVSLVDVERGEHVPSAVGFAPGAARFSADGSRLAVVSDGLLAAFDLTEEEPWPTLYRLDEDQEEPAATGEVLLSFDGATAVARLEDLAEVVVVDLLAEEVSRIDVDWVPSDIDLVPDGTRVLAVIRADNQLQEIDIALEEVTDVWFMPEPFGQLELGPDGERGLLYTNAQPLAEVGLWEAGEGEVHSIPLVKPVDAVSLDPTGETALVFHTLADAADADPDSPFSGTYALTMLALDDTRSHPLRLSSPVQSFAHGDLGRTGYLVLKNRPWLEVLDYRRLLYEEVPLRSDPVYTGTLAPEGWDDPMGWVIQEHELGRISFWYPEEEVLETLTGYELNGGVD